ncbi:MAG: trehalose-phosphatase [Methanobacterium sp.]|nr:trehalose-phosphatase [Methanobacterium sp.]
MAKYLLNSLKYLEKFKEEDSVVITDIDGTISEIGPEPKNATITPEMRNLLLDLSSKYKYIGVLTGRDINDAIDIIKLEKIVYMGNHGLQQIKNGKIITDPRIESYIPIIKEISRELHQRFENITGISFNYKKLSLTVHYNNCNSKNKAKKELLNTIYNLKKGKLVKIIEGRELLEIRPPVGYDKGSVLHEFISENHIKKIIYIGDDINDISAFRKLKELSEKNEVKGISIAVNSIGTPEEVKESANFYVENVKETYNFLEWLSDHNDTHSN